MKSIKEEHERFRALVEDDLEEMHECMSFEVLASTRLYRCYVSQLFFAECFPTKLTREHYLDDLEAARSMLQESHEEDQTLRRLFLEGPDSFKPQSY